MRDFIENLEAGAELRYEEMVQPDGRLKCDCGRIFDADEEGGHVSSNPYAMPVCGTCLEEYIKDMKEKKSQDAQAEMGQLERRVVSPNPSATSICGVCFEDCIKKESPTFVESAIKLSSTIKKLWTVIKEETIGRKKRS